MAFYKSCSFLPWMVDYKQFFYSLSSAILVGFVLMDLGQDKSHCGLRFPEKQNGDSTFVL